MHALYLHTPKSEERLLLLFFPFFFYFPINGKDAARGCIVDIGTCSSTGMISSIKIRKMVNDKIMMHLGLNSSKIDKQL